MTFSISYTGSEVEASGLYRGSLTEDWRLFAIWTLNRFGITLVSRAQILTSVPVSTSHEHHVV